MKPKWKQWLAGLIDGGGYLGISGYTFLEITMKLEDQKALSQIKQKLGGSLKLRSNANAIRYRLKSKNEMINLINLINGEIRNTVRVEQLKKVCNKLQIQYLQAAPLTKNNGYTAGVFDAEGSITISVQKTDTKTSTLSGVEGKINRLILARGFHQLLLKITNKYECNVSLFHSAFNIGCVICDRGHHWYFKKRSDVFEFIEYTKKYPLRSSKKKRLFLVKSYFKLFEQKAHLAPQNTILNKAWQRFCKKWFSFEH